MNEELNERISALRRSSSPYFRDKNFLSMIEPLGIAWSLIPEPKFDHDESFLVSRMMCEAYLGMEDYVIAKEWVEQYKKADLVRIDSGERDFMEARLYYHQGDFEKSKELFAIADKKSDGRLFKNKDYMEYYKFYKQK